MAKTVDMVNMHKPRKFAVRNHHRCRLCGRSRGYMRKFSLCRICFRQRALVGELPGVRKASW